METLPAADVQLLLGRGRRRCGGGGPARRPQASAPREHARLRPRRGERVLAKKVRLYKRGSLTWLAAAAASYQPDADWGGR